MAADEKVKAIIVDQLRGLIPPNYGPAKKQRDRRDLIRTITYERLRSISYVLIKGGNVLCIR